MVGPENELLHAFVPIRYGAKHALQVSVFGRIAAAQQSERAQAQRSAQNSSAINPLDQLAIFVNKTFYPCRQAAGRSISKVAWRPLVFS